MKKLIISLVLLLVLIAVHGQGKKSMVIGAQVDKPNAVLVINPPNSNQGFLLPQLTAAQRLSIGPASPTDDGLLVYDITAQSFYYWSSGQWIQGLGDNGKGLSYDAATHTLTLGSGSVNLSPLKEIPAQVGNGGKFLTTDGTNLSWANIANVGDITSIIAGAGLTGGTSSGDATIAVNPDGTSISINGTNQLQISDGGVTEAKIKPGAADQVLTTDGTGTTVQWVTPGGDIAGPVAATKVTRLQGRDVSGNAPNPGETLTWNGTAWAPAPTAVAVATEYYSVDPADFQALQPAGNNDPTTGLYQADNTFVSALNGARQIIAPVNLPHGATIVNVTVYYLDNDATGDIDMRFIRKRLDGGANEILGQANPILVSLVVQSQNLTVAAANRVVDNNTYSYRMQIILSHVADYQTALVSLQKIFGVKIEYTK